jgi:hypothetical protein
MMDATPWIEIVCPSLYGRRTLYCGLDSKYTRALSIQDLTLRFWQLDIPEGSLYFTRNGKVLTRNDQVFPQDCIHVHARLFGGKGGFGSLLKGKRQKNKVENVDECRDLYGNRIGDVLREQEGVESENHDSVEEARGKNEALTTRQETPIDKAVASTSQQQSTPETDSIDLEKLETVGNRISQMVRKGLQVKRKAETDHEESGKARKPLIGHENRPKKNVWVDSSSESCEPKDQT